MAFTVLPKLVFILSTLVAIIVHHYSHFTLSTMVTCIHAV